MVALSLEGAVTDSGYSYAPVPEPKAIKIDREIGAVGVQEAILELLNPVLHMVEVPELVPDVRNLLNAAQAFQAAYLLEARRNVTDKAFRSYEFEHMIEPANEKWQSFGRAIAPMGFIEATQRRKKVTDQIKDNTKSDAIYDFCYSAGLKDKETILERFYQANRALYRGVSTFYPRVDVPFGLHVAMTAINMNYVLRDFRLIVHRLSQEQIGILKEITPKEDSNDFFNAFFSSQGFLKGNNISEQALNAERSVFSEKYLKAVNQMPIERLPPDKFPYKAPHFITDSPQMPKGVRNMKELEAGYKKEIRGIRAQIVRARIKGIFAQK